MCLATFAFDMHLLHTGQLVVGPFLLVSIVAAVGCVVALVVAVVVWF